MYDVDQHPQLAQAAGLAGGHRINPAISSPCIERWFVLHLQDQAAHIERRAAKSRIVELLGQGKSLSQEAPHDLDERYAEAADRARKLDAKREGDGSAPGTNPSTGIWRLVDTISTP